VTVIVPAFNAAGALAEAIRSIREQRCAIELVVVDDGSTDDTARVARDGDARVLRQENRGPSAARNAGLAVASAPLVAFLDADDLWPLGSLAARIAYLDAHPDAHYVQGRIRDLWPGLAATGGDQLDPPRSGFNVGCALFRRALFDAIGGFDDSRRHGEDVDLLVRAAAHGQRPGRIADVTLIYRRRLYDDVGAYRRHIANLTGAVKRTLDARRRRDG
jgi:glycosyltransferase involved in cell wall biosynthesis